MGLTDAPDGVLTASPDHAVGAEHPNGDSAYSTIFQRLAPESDDIVGLVAYGLYKQSKRDWVIRHQKQHGEKPDDIERQRFHDHFSDDDLQRFRSEAEARLVDFAEAYFQSRRPDIENQIRAVEFTSTKQAIIDFVRDRTKFWGAVWASIVAWVLTVGVTVMVMVMFNFGLIVNALRKAFGAE